MTEISAHSLVFIHSGFRTASTWVWERFRRCPDVLAYYECFNESLAKLDDAGIERNRYDSWQSGHPATAPYFEEYRPLLTARGVRGFDPDFAFARMIPHEGALTAAEGAYLRDLITHARGLGKLPVISCTRSMARAGALRREFGGLHVLVLRNLYQQWCSYSSQARRGNLFFIQTIFKTIAGAPDDPCLKMLGNLLSEHGVSAADAVFDATRHDALFAVFVALQAYLALLAFPHADIVLDINRLGQDPPEAERLESLMRSQPALKEISLAGATDRIEVPVMLIRDVAVTRASVLRLVEHALTTARPSAEASAWLMQQIEDLWREEAAHRKFASAAMAALTPTQLRDAGARAGASFRRGMQVELSAGETSYWGADLFSSKTGARKPGALICKNMAKGSAVFGPYLRLPRGEYRVSYHVDWFGELRAGRARYVVAAEGQRIAVCVGNAAEAAAPVLAFTHDGTTRLECRIILQDLGLNEVLAFYGVTVERLK